MLKWFVGAIALLAVACGEVSETSTPVLRDGEGLVELPLVSTSAGRSYKLVGATFAITGPQNTSVTDTSAETVSVPLIAGAYSIQLNEGWHVERTDAPGVTVPVTLVSPNPMTFTLGEGETRPVRFLFKVPEDGTANVGIGVDTGGWISGTIQFEPYVGPLPADPPDYFAELRGKSVPFVINFESATVTRVDEYWSKRVLVETGPITFQFGGAPSAVLQQFASALRGLPLYFTLEGGSQGAGWVPMIHLQHPSGSFMMDLEVSRALVEVDSEGFPLMTPFSFNESNLTFIRQFMGNASGTVNNGTFSPR
ncbi:hypothetical protein D7W81_10390 [Corallococcus aberystwythensis]|uniref:Lipoprotein n=2 Tax=Corallococcus aberystwythensis TaxID=2316722 RepID=A0A3A8QMA0_9BACT|nr:hypothetical protein D7W81_10390 [Corallococcus aberystwythensis]